MENSIIIIVTFLLMEAWFDGVKKRIGSGNSKCNVDSPVPCDDNGHGTHTLSTAVGANGIGAAPDSKWIGCRNMYAGFGSTETYLNCLQFFLAPTDLKVRPCFNLCRETILIQI